MRSPIANEYLPEHVSLPGETLQEVLNDRQMSQADLAERTGRPKKTINEIVKGKTAITPETALQLERVLGVPAGFWNNLERSYQDFMARKQEDALLAASTDWLKRIPVSALIKRGWIERRSRQVDQVRAILSFFGVASPSEWQQVFEVPQASFRHSQVFESDPGALAAWLRKGEIEAQEVRTRPFDRAKFQDALVAARALTVKTPEEFVPLLVKICAAAGVAVAFVPELPKCRAHGATRWVSPTKALVQLSLRHKTDDHLWFTFFHEAAHILLHGKRLTFIEGGNADSTTEEEQANRFAADFLIPQESLEALRSQAMARRLSEARVRSFAEELGIAAGIVVGRLQHIGWLPHTHLNGLKVSLRWTGDPG
jgi:HTH-type transcriptional regulator / antitoxin HigA